MMGSKVNSFTVEVNEECAEITILAGLYAADGVIERMASDIKFILTMDGPAQFAVSLESDVELIWIDEGSQLHVTVGSAPDHRTRVCLYNTEAMAANTFARILAYLTTFKAK